MSATPAVRRQPKTKLDVSLSYGCPRLGIPARTSFVRWAMATLQHLEQHGSFDLSIRIVDEDEGLALNRDFRGKSYATNVLSFPSDTLKQRGPRVLGDIALCAPVVKREANEQAKTLSAHYAHLTIHSVLHLLGFDHQEDAAATQMEALEVQILQGFAYADPYADPIHVRHERGVPSV